MSNQCVYTLIYLKKPRTNLKTFFLRLHENCIVHNHVKVSSKCSNANYQKDVIRFIILKVILLKLN